MASSLNSYNYNSRNQLTAVGGTTYSYDAESHRIRVNISGTDTMMLSIPRRL